MVAKEGEEGGRAGGEYLYIPIVRARRRTRRPNQTMNRFHQKTNGRKVQQEKVRS